MSGFLTQAGFVCGMQSEAVILRRALKSAINPLRILCSGPGQSKAREAALELTERGCSILISAGIAGGLDPTLEAGDLVVAEHVCMPGRDAWVCDEDITGWLAERTGALHRGGLWSVPDPVTGTAAKAALAAQGWLAVDMESGSVAAVAAEKGFRFACLRVIADTAGDSIPPVALKGLDESGNRRIWPVLAGLMKSPGQLGALLALGRRSQAAHARLLGAALAISDG